MTTPDCDRSPAPSPPIVRGSGRPRAVAVALAGSTIVTAGLVLLSLTSASAAALGSGPVFHDLLGWCDPYVGHNGRWWWVSIPLGLMLLGILGRMAWRLKRFRCRSRPLGATPILVTSYDLPVAYSVPGRPGQVVVSEAMLRCLNGEERRALLAHERSHLRHGHHRYLLLADLASTVLPARPLCRLLRFYLERWADEDAAQEVGSRKVVARAISRAALTATVSMPVGALGFSSLGVPARVQAMIAGSDGQTYGAHARMAGLAFGASVTTTSGLALIALKLCGL